MNADKADSHGFFFPIIWYLYVLKWRVETNIKSAFEKKKQELWLKLTSLPRIHPGFQTWLDVSWFDLSWFDTNHVTCGFAVRKRCKQRQARVLPWDPKELEKHLGGKEGFTPKNVSATKLESRQTHFTWRGRLYCVESGNLRCLPFDGKFRKFRMEGKW